MVAYRTKALVRSKYYTPFQERSLKWIPRSKSGVPKATPSGGAYCIVYVTNDPLGGRLLSLLKKRVFLQNFSYEVSLSCLKMNVQVKHILTRQLRNGV